jgi:hypothetical protein
MTTELVYKIGIEAIRILVTGGSGFLGCNFILDWLDNPSLADLRFPNLKN